jgi:transcriptional regulator GlxA family with amidase domain
MSRHEQNGQIHGRIDILFHFLRAFAINNRRASICLLAAPEATPAVLYGLYDVLTSVGVAYQDLTTGTPGEELLEVKIVAKTREPFRCTGNVPVEPHAGIDEITHADAIVVCDMYTPIDKAPKGIYETEVEWLKQMYARNTLLTSVCSGSGILAETGLLNGLEVSGHWAYRHMFRENYPDVVWRENAVLSLSGEQNRLITAGGLTSWQDLAMYLITRYCGLKHAINTAKVFLITQHTEGQLPFAAMTQSNQHNDAVVRKCQLWITENYTQLNPVKQMIDRSGLKPRTFARRFRAATGYDPLKYIQYFRIEMAKELLEMQAIGVDEVSFAVGYEDTNSFRKLFKRNTGLTPTTYRKKFSGISGKVQN